MKINLKNNIFMGTSHLCVIQFSVNNSFYGQSIGNYDLYSNSCWSCIKNYTRIFRRNSKHKIFSWICVSVYGQGINYKFAMWSCSMGKSKSQSRNSTWMIGAACPFRGRCVCVATPRHACRSHALGIPAAHATERQVCPGPVSISSH